MGARRAVLAAVVAAALAVPLTAVSASADDVGTSPKSVLAGAATGLSGAWGTTVDSHGYTYVTDGNAVRVYAPGATGNAAPVRVISGAATLLSSPQGVAVNPAGYVFVASSGSASVSVYAPGADGNVAPVRRIAGPATTLAQPGGLRLTSQGGVLVSDVSADAVVEFAPTASGNVAPRKRLAGPATQIDWAYDLALGSDGALYVATHGGVLVFAAMVDGNVAPVREIGGLTSGLGFVTGVAVDSSKDVYAASYYENMVVVFGPGANGDATPLRRLTGASTQLSAPLGVYLRGDRALVAVQAGSLAVNTYAPLVPFRAPSAVRALGVSGSTKAATRTVSWQAPATSGGKAVTGYTVVVKHGSKTLLSKHVSASTRSVKVARATLSPGTNTVTVRAVNAVGSGSSASKAFKATFSKPGKVRSLAVHGSSKATSRSVTWKTPTSTGGKPVTKYVVTVKKGSKTLWSKTVKASTHKVSVPRSKLRAGTDTVYVKAVTSIGTGSAASKSFTVKK
ncbi:fibronectin type III domain-containing protein [Cellulomonas sp. JH27-2]|uniref:fibronectin type III domain-containing protein n=1 Tax=Cellulomonas sp. JH27-2 TaxID=2774139 RepID=UPI00177F8F0F|nr:fibronectin type III domain-containing protein [Cellulomonas sp. JH27-2]MBD8057601.1 fibronectin type III domain-containing protein [Cellulomonas sp. JH27-2]